MLGRGGTVGSGAREQSSSQTRPPSSSGGLFLNVNQNAGRIFWLTTSVLVHVLRVLVEESRPAVGSGTPRPVPGFPQLLIPVFEHQKWSRGCRIHPAGLCRPCQERLRNKRKAGAWASLLHPEPLRGSDGDEWVDSSSAHTEDTRLHPQWRGRCGWSRFSSILLTDFSLCGFNYRIYMPSLIFCLRMSWQRAVLFPRSPQN